MSNEAMPALHVYRVLFLCTGNSARSIMAEALLNTIGKGRFQAFSAGSHPTGKVNLFAIEKVKSLSYPTDQLRSKNWDEFAKAGTTPMDMIITVCDNAAGEVCPVWPGHPATAHWSFSDPTAVAGSDEVKRRAFDLICRQIQIRVQLLVNLKPEQLDKLTLSSALKKIADSTASAQ